MKAKSDKGQQPDYLSDNGLSESTAYRAKKCRRGNVNSIPTIINISKKKKKKSTAQVYFGVAIRSK